MSRLVYIANVATLRLDPSRCCGCGMCATVCPHGVLLVVDGVAEIVHLDACMECGACANNCPSGALQVEAGVGCAAAVVNSILGRTDPSCCCVIEKPGGEASHRETPSGSSSGCC